MADAGRAASIVPFYSYLWKVASRCNLDCTYCYVYNLADQTWRTRPKFMSEETARQTARRMREHLLANRGDGPPHALISFHGGEPMLAGAERLARYLEIIDEELSDHGVVVKFSMQSNMTVFDEEIGEVLLGHDVRVGTSLDGPPAVNDIHRIDHRGQGTGVATEEGIRRMLEPRFRELYDGILCVVNPFEDPVAVVEHLRGLSPAMIDFLLPLGNHDRRPDGKDEWEATPYGDWLIGAFDHWWATGGTPAIRIFDAIMRLSCGLSSPVESLGLEVIDLVVVETDGSIEGLDSLKGTYEGATDLGLNVFDNSFDEAARHAKVQMRQIGAGQLCETCRQCPVVGICGGGYLPHRYSEADGFANPSVYCRDLEKIIRHIYGTLQSTVGSALGEQEMIRKVAAS